MSCSKVYGGGTINVARETTPGDVVALTASGFIHAQAASIGALSRESLDNTALRANRGRDAAFNGPQSEITWEITCNMPATRANAGTGFNDLLWAAGFNDAYLEPGSICMRTLQIARTDRDGTLLEILNGAIVQQVVWNYSTNDMPTVVFSGTASSKAEVYAGKLPEAISWTSSDDVALTSYPTPRESYMLLGGESSFELPEGIDFLGADASGAEVHVLPSSASISATGLHLWEVASAGTDIVNIKMVLPQASTRPAVIDPDAWAFASSTGEVIHARSLTLTLETGSSYGELTAGDIVPVERLSGSLKTTGSFNVYLDHEAITAIKHMDGATGYKVTTTGGITQQELARVKATATPAFELSTDDAASADVEIDIVDSSINGVDALSYPGSSIS